MEMKEHHQSEQLIIIIIHKLGAIELYQYDGEKNHL